MSVGSSKRVTPPSAGVRPLRLRRVTYGLATAHRRSSGLNAPRMPFAGLASTTTARDAAFPGSRPPFRSEPPENVRFQSGFAFQWRVSA